MEKRDRIFQRFVKVAAWRGRKFKGKMETHRVLRKYNEKHRKNPVKGDVVTTLDALKESKSQNIILVGFTFNRGALFVDEYQKRYIKFLNCRIENVSWIAAQKTKVVFQDCYFGNCKRELREKTKEENEFDAMLDSLLEDAVNPDRFVEERIFDQAIISCKNADFVNCIFEKCGQKNVYELGVFIAVKKGTFHHCTFKECIVTVDASGELHSSCEYGTLVYTAQVSIKDCKFLSCACHGNGIRRRIGALLSMNGADYECLSMINSTGGSIENCEFKNCSCAGMSAEDSKKYNYIINGIDVMESGNKFIKCTVVTNVGKKGWEII